MTPIIMTSRDLKIMGSLCGGKKCFKIFILFFFIDFLMGCLVIFLFIKSSGYFYLKNTETESKAKVADKDTYWGREHLRWASL